MSNETQKPAAKPDGKSVGAMRSWLIIAAAVALFFMFAIEQSVLKGNNSTLGVEGNAVRGKGCGLEETGSSLQTEEEAGLP